MPHKNKNYTKILNVMYKHLRKKVTTDLQLNKIGKLIFGKLYLGTFSSDVKKNKIDMLAKNNVRTYFIINTTGKKSKGEHWMAVVKDNDKYHIYDTYARKISTLKMSKFLKSIKCNYVNVNKQTDQYDRTEVCGQKSMAVLLYVKLYGLHKISDI